MHSRSERLGRRMNFLHWMGARPSRWLMVSMALYWINFFLGPYDYVTNSGPSSWLYLALVFFLFWLGLFAGERYRRLPRTIRYGGCKLSETHERVLIGVMVFFAVVSVYNFVSYMDISGGGFGLQSGEARNTLDELAALGYQRPILAKIADGMATSSLAFALLVLSCRTKYLLSVYLAIFAPGVTAITQLFTGGRNGAALIIVVLTTAFLLRRMAGLRENLGMIRIQRVLIALGVFSVIMMVLMFAWRSGLNAQSDLDVSSPFVWNGTTIMRDFYRILNDGCDGCLSGLYMLSYYAGHSAAFFSTLFEASDYSNPHYGLFHFRIYDLAIGRGTAGFIEIIHSQPFYGLYPTAVQGLLLDFGVIATPLVALLLGILLGVVGNVAIRGGPIAGCYLPLVLSIVAISPIYYFLWGGADFVVAGLTALLLGLLALSFITKIRLFSRTSLGVK